MKWSRSKIVTDLFRVVNSKLNHTVAVFGCFCQKAALLSNGWKVWTSSWTSLVITMIISFFNEWFRLCTLWSFILVKNTLFFVSGNYFFCSWSKHISTCLTCLSFVAIFVKKTIIKDAHQIVFLKTPLISLESINDRGNH